MAPRLPMPRIILNRRPSSRSDSPGLSSFPATIDPIITLDAPFDGVDALLDQRRRPVARAHLAGPQLRGGKPAADDRRRREHGLAVARGGSDDQAVAAATDERAGRVEETAARPDRRRGAQ